MPSFPSCLIEYVKKNNLLQLIHNAMKSDDNSDVVMVVLNILEEHNLIPKMKKMIKSEEKSNQFRNEGNIEFKKGNYYKALENYNQALMYAPQNSESEKLAYSNRSAVLFKNDEYIACIVDIQICFRLGCSLNIIKKLKKRMEQASLFIEYEKSVRKQIVSHASKFYQFDVDASVNAQIPSTSTDIEVVMENNVKKIVAAKDIKVGTVLANEPSFVSCNSSHHILIACHYCHKISLNLIPCYGCCFALFCNEKCKKLCMNEYHKIECEIMEIIAFFYENSMNVLMVQGAIKFVQMCESWREVISSSYCTGEDRINTTSVNEMFDVNNKLSVLSYSNDRLFVHGQIFNTSFICAIVIHYLEKVPGFMPRLHRVEKIAKKALGRLMMYFKLCVTPTLMKLYVSNKKGDEVNYSPLLNFGWFPFTSKLKDSCMPNVLVSNINKNIVLIALQPIKKGTELTISHIGHHIEIEKFSLHEINCNKFNLFGKLCKCNICSKNFQRSKCSINDDQLDICKLFFLGSDIKINMLTIHYYLPKMFELLTCLNNAPLSNEYYKVFKKMSKYLILCQVGLTNNFVFNRFQIPYTSAEVKLPD